ncbi:CBS / octicosapeptide/Phox/Bemp1 (PB1) domains-containing protein isoform 3 [Theobroma cacao]|uniref:CBS / octicosapeptide/Phox/Bemp1 (PB1) domains-containing protein isoform 3 n=1 Tax=Theobroma cacao TaxID=3641 RepID=A0A061FZK3_THECC|nr:CBS / octicosapeptide/Phox/Bemp1 (PB1) domains-containing protein isoform 3 [Theobroma cacao]
MASQGGSSRRSLSVVNSASGRKKTSENVGSDSGRKLLPSSRPMGLAGERTVKRLRLSKALTVPESTSIYEACRRMAARRVDALLLTDSNALLCGILTDKDIATRVIARELNLEETPVSKVMTRNPVFVLSDTLAVEALQKMVQGKFRHLPVVENGEVIALLDIAKCLYDAIARMERAAEKGKAIAAAVEGVEKNWGASFAGQNTFIEALRERMFRPSLSTIISDNSKIVTVSPTDSVLATAKKMLESRLSSAVVTVENKPRGILTSKDILMRVISQNLPPESTLVEKVMTPNPECATVDTPIVDALHTMHDGKFLHLPVVDRDGEIVAVVDVLHITHAAVATVSQVGSTSGINNEATTTMMQKFWDSAMALPPNEDDDETRSDNSLKLASDGGETARSLPYPSSSMPNTFGFKIQDKRGRMHRFTL